MTNKRFERELEAESRELDEARDEVEKLARVAYEEYVQLREVAEFGNHYEYWDRQKPEVRNAWRLACELTEGIHNPPMAARARGVRLEDL